MSLAPAGSPTVHASHFTHLVRFAVGFGLGPGVAGAADPEGGAGVMGAAVPELP